MPQQTIVVLNGTARTFKHLIPQALAKGHRVRAVVRSAPRFLSQTKKHDDLSVYEWSDFLDLTTLATILDGADVVYLAYVARGTALSEPSRLNEQVATSIATVLRNTVAPGSRSPTKLVILTSHSTRPGEPPVAVMEALIGNQFSDLRATQEYLTKQSGWLDVVFITPGGLLDCESSDDPAQLEAVELSEHGVPDGFTSYSRLASAMQLAAADDKWVGKYVVPLATTKVAWKFSDAKEALEIVQTYVWRKVLPAAMLPCVLATLGATLGYVLGVRDQGQWPLRVFGLNLAT